VKIEEGVKMIFEEEMEEEWRQESLKIDYRC